ncbi:MAG TPA: putative nucleotide-diphospho-sugar transferase [Planctomycetota bacterium]|nr:putative nucleotide-diphospho-sugar transferase [Planctomycetota bacterium]
MRIVSYSGDQFDGQFALRLKKSARALELDCELYRWPRENKPHADRIRYLTLLRSLSGRAAEDLLFVDPESQFLQRPDALLDEKDFDIGVYYDSRTMAVSGPLFLRHTPRLETFLSEWGEANESFPEHSDLENLSQVLAGPRTKVEIRRLPVTYAWVERQHRSLYPDAKPIIVHYKTDGLLSTRMRRR